MNYLGKSGLVIGYHELLTIHNKYSTSMQKLIIRRILVSAIGAIVILWIGSYIQSKLANRQSPVRQMSFQEQKRTVKTTPVEYKSREISLSNMGKVVSERAVDIISEVQGEILPGSVPLKRGQAFREGQILMKIDDTEARLTIYAQKSDFMTAVANILPDLKIDYPDTYQKWQSYFDQLTVSDPLSTLPAIETSQEKVFFSTRNIINQYYNIKSAEERLDKYIIRAPFSGSYSEVLQEPGAVVNSGTKVARITRSNRLEIELPLRTEDLDFVRPGTMVNITSSSRRNTWKGRVVRVSDIVDPTTQSVNTYIAFTPSNERVYDGQYLEVEIPGTRLKDVMEIPRNAVFNQNEIFVVKENRLSVQPIQIEKFNEETLFFSGLDEGAMVVTEPLINAYENMEVVIEGTEEPANISKSTDESSEIKTVNTPSNEDNSTDSSADKLPENNNTSPSSSATN